MKEADIEIKCPHCEKKAFFYALEQVNHHTIIVPRLEGKIVCSYCGLNKQFKFSSENYYYQIPVNKKIVYARTLKNLIQIKKYFENGGKISSPDFDFPKEFYQHKIEIIKNINSILDKDKDIG